ncbi:uncharacterized protein VTP21DRAFT_10629 [Calcarisporiella thermophila]|uniref:uncharacterized protein n=1 Tax=Calcarisporiella thermophila TaxID=911321 RepID=UPI0037449914
MKLTALPVRYSLSYALLTRSYAGLAYNSPAPHLTAASKRVQGVSTLDRKVSDTHENKATENWPATTISKQSEDINSGSKWVTPGIPDPSFQVVSAGLGSALLVKLLPNSEITAASGSALGLSSDVHADFTTDGNVLKAISRKLVGDTLYYQKFSTGNLSGDILLAPRRVSDIAAIQMDGTSAYYVRRDSFLAKGPRVVVQVGVRGMKGSGVGLFNSFTHHITGRGPLAISGYGGIYRLVLGVGEEYLVHPKLLIAWDARTNPTKALPRSTGSRLNQYSAVRNTLSNPYVKGIVDSVSRVSAKLKTWLIGNQEFVRLKGPGDFYLASRVEPTFEGLKLATSSLARSREQKRADTLSKEPVPPVPALNRESPSYFATVTTGGGVNFEAVGVSKSTSSSALTSSSTPVAAASVAPANTFTATAPSSERISEGTGYGGVATLRRWILGSRPKVEKVDKRE